MNDEFRAALRTLSVEAPTLDGTYPSESAESYTRFVETSSLTLMFNGEVGDADGVVNLTYASPGSDAERPVAQLRVRDGAIVGRSIVFSFPGFEAGQHYTVTVDGRVKPPFGAWAPMFVDAASATFTTVPRVRFELEQTVGLPPVLGMATGVGHGNVVHLVGGEGTNAAKAVETGRDMDAAAGMAPASQCLEPCKPGAMKSRTFRVWRGPTPRGRRGLDSLLRSHSGSWTYRAPVFTEPCACPVCIYGPPENADVGQYRKTGVPDSPVPTFARELNYQYLKQTRGDTRVTVPCRVGIPDGLREEEYAGVRVRQGYKLMTEVECSVQDVDLNPTAEFYAVWRVRPDACEPKNCTVQPDYHSKTGKYCKLNETGGFFLEHGQGCEIMCKSGYAPTHREFVCDRGIFTQKPECIKQECEIPELPDESTKGWSFPKGREVGERTTPRCHPGHEPYGRMRCTPPPGKTNYEALPRFVPHPANSKMPSCRPMQCQDPPAIPNGFTDGCEGQLFGDQCLVTCNPGFFVFGTFDIAAATPCVGTVGTDPTKRENDPATGLPINLAQYVDVPEWVPLICPEPQVDNGEILTCPSFWEDKCEVQCNRGFSSKGLWSRSGQPIVFTCTDINRTGVFLTEDPTDACEELSCPVTPLELEPNVGHLFAPGAHIYPPAANYNCSVDKVMKPGEICIMTCQAGYQLPDEVIYLGCRLGQYVGYTSADMNTTKTLTAPTCRPYGSVATEVTVVESQMRLALGYEDDVEKLTHPSARKPVGEGIKGSFVAVAKSEELTFDAEYTVYTNNILSLDQNSRRLDENEDEDEFDSDASWQSRSSPLMR